MEIEIFNSKTLKPYGTCIAPAEVNSDELPTIIHQQLPNTPTPERQSLRLNPNGKAALKKTEKLNIQNRQKIYIKDLGPQVGWKTVFLAEYAGPLFVYLIFYTRPSLIYESQSKDDYSYIVHTAAVFYVLHYVKRILETIFVHRFSHATMPLLNLFKNCSYYWGFTAYVSYHVNHPLFQNPPVLQFGLAAVAFLLCELGNFSAHILLRDLRPPGTKVRRIPQPNGNIFNSLFNFVSCPNYTYEIGAWVSFALMTSCLPAFLFAIAGALQMTMWAIAKHRNYLKEFSNYPKRRRAIFPCFI